jgi:hypothetical protein
MSVLKMTEEGELNMIRTAVGAPGSNGLDLIYSQN